MRSGSSFVLGAVAGVLGLVLMVVETIRVLNGSALNGLNNALLFVGLGLLAVGGVLLVLAVVVETAPSRDAALSAEAAPVEETADDPA